MSADLYWPADLVPYRSSVRVVDSVGRWASSVTSYMQTVGRPGSLLEMSMSFRALQTSKRRQLQSIIAACRGGTRPFYLPDHTYTQSDFHSVSELVPSVNFASDLTSYTTGSSWSSAVKERVPRFTRSQNTAAAAGLLRPTSALTTTPYQAYAGRAIVLPGRGPYDSLQLSFGSSAFASDYYLAQSLDPGLLTAAFVPTASSVHFSVRQGVVAAIAGDYLDVPFISFGACALVDNGVNLLRHTEEMAENPSFWPNTATTWTDDATAAPDGQTTADSLVENTANSTHYTQGSATCTSAVQDLCFAVALKAGSRGFARIVLLSTGGTSINAYVNLSTGVISNTGTGADWANLRTYSKDLGNSWWYVAIVGQKNSSDTTLTARIQLASAAGTDSYTGTTSNIYVWRPTVATSSVPVRLTNNGATADTTGQDQNLGGGIYIKGLTAYASTSELLKRGARININGQTQILEGPLDVDATGRGFLPIPSLRSIPADNDPVIFVNPLLRMIPIESENSWTNELGDFSDCELNLSEVA